MDNSRRYVLITYDTPSDRRRRRIAAILEDYGTRVQYSVFAAWLNDRCLDQLTGELHAAIRPAEDSIYLTRFCRRCEREIHTLGLAHVRPPADYWII